jgi:hypothetical protein
LTIVEFQCISGEGGTLKGFSKIGPREGFYKTKGSARERKIAGQPISELIMSQEGL